MFLPYKVPLNGTEVSCFSVVSVVRYDVSTGGYYRLRFQLIDNFYISSRYDCGCVICAGCVNILPNSW